MADNKANKPEKPGDKQPAKAAPLKGDDKKADMPSRRNSFIAIVLLVSVAILVWRFYLEPKYMTQYRAPEGQQGVTVETTGLPKIGGPFTLVDHNGKTVTEKDFMGKYMMIYFGYTYCPDVCPTSLTLIADAFEILGDKAEQITPVFITVDPERDDPEATKMYVEHFHDRLVGLTGSMEQVDAAAKAFKAYYAKVGDGYNDDDYAMDHSSITYLMGPDGNFVTHFGHGTEPDVIAKKLAGIL